jgi:hypothetical protein
MKWGVRISMLLRWECRLQLLGADIFYLSREAIRTAVSTAADILYVNRAVILTSVRIAVGIF